MEVYIKGKGSSHRSVINQLGMARGPILCSSRSRLRRLLFNNPNPLKMVRDGKTKLKKAPEGRLKIKEIK